MREWLSGGAPPCQGGGRGFDPRLALSKRKDIRLDILFCCLYETHILSSEECIVSSLISSDLSAESLLFSHYGLGSGSPV